MHAERDGLFVIHAPTILLRGISSFTLRERIKSRVSDEAQSTWQQSVANEYPKSEVREDRFYSLFWKYLDLNSSRK